MKFGYGSTVGLRDDTKLGMSVVVAKGEGLGTNSESESQ